MMLGLFRRKPLVDPDTMEWMLDQAAWLLGSHAHAAGFAKAGLVLPKPGFFVTDGETGHALALRLMQDVQHYAGVPDMKIALTADPRSGRFSAYGPVVVQPKSSAAGLYMPGGDEIAISYDVEFLKQPGDLIAILAHELAHAVLDLGAAAEPAAREEALEMLTDFTSVFLGFGVFAAYFRSDTRVWSREAATEWQSLYENYMNFNEAAAATALFALVHEMDRDSVVRDVRDDLAIKLRTAFRDWEVYGEPVARLRGQVGKLAG
jgi:hypothetical protein